MIEISRDGKRIYFAHSLHSTWDTQLYPEGVLGEMVMAHNGANGFALDRGFHVAFPGGLRAHQIRLEGSDCSTESFCVAPAGVDGKRRMRADTAWVMILAMGLYQGQSPPMGWLRAVGRGLETRSGRTVLASTVAHAAGNYCAMAAVLVPAALLALAGVRPSVFIPWLGVALIGFGLFKLYRPTHPRFLARDCGSPIMTLSPLVVLMMILDMRGHAGHAAAVRALHFGRLALTLPAAMTLALLSAAGAIAWVIWQRIGLAPLTRVWLILDRLWAPLFVIMAAMDVATATMGGGVSGTPFWPTALTSRI